MPEKSTRKQRYARYHKHRPPTVGMQLNSIALFVPQQPLFLSIHDTRLLCCLLFSQLCVTHSDGACAIWTSTHILNRWRLCAYLYGACECLCVCFKCNTVHIYFRFIRFEFLFEEIFYQIFHPYLCDTVSGTLLS